MPVVTKTLPIMYITPDPHVCMLLIKHLELSLHLLWYYLSVCSRIDISDRYTVNMSASSGSHVCM